MFIPKIKNALKSAYLLPFIGDLASQRNKNTHLHFKIILHISPHAESISLPITSDCYGLSVLSLSGQLVWSSMIIKNNARNCEYSNRSFKHKLLLPIRFRSCVIVPFALNFISVAELKCWEAVGVVNKSIKNIFGRCKKIHFATARLVIVTIL